MSGFKLGELVVSSKPYAYVLSNEYRGQFCDYCFKKNDDLKRCSQCSFLYFCDRKCQINAWEDHKIECKCIKRAGEKIPPPSLRHIARIILKIKKYGQEEPYEEVNGRKISFSTLMSHVEDIKKDLKRCQIMVAMIITLKEYIGANNVPSSDEFIEIFGKMVINSFSIDHETSLIGTGLYLGASIFDHSCNPDAVPVFDGTELNVRMMRDLPHRDISRVYITYNNKVHLKAERQRDLKEQYYFTCQCSYCSTSQYEVTMAKLLNINEETISLALECEQEFKKLDQMYIDKGDLRDLNRSCKELLKIENEIMADTNVCKVRTLELALDVCIAIQEWDDALKYAACLEEPLKLYYGKYTPHVAVHFYRIGKILHLIERSDLAVPKLIEAENILKVTHGEQHQLTKKLQELLQEARLAPEFTNTAENRITFSNY